MQPTNRAMKSAEPTESLDRRTTPAFRPLHGPAAPPEGGHSPPVPNDQDHSLWPVPPWCSPLPRMESAPSTAVDRAPHAATNAALVVASRQAPCPFDRASHPKHDADESLRRPAPLLSHDQDPAAAGPAGSVPAPHPHRHQLQPLATPSMPAGVAQFRCSKGWSRAIGLMHQR